MKRRTDGWTRQKRPELLDWFLQVEPERGGEVEDARFMKINANWRHGAGGVVQQTLVQQMCVSV